MIVIKGFAITKKNIPINQYIPIHSIYDTREEAEDALRENRMCIIVSDDFWVREFELTIK